MGEWENGRMGEWENGRMGEWEKGRKGERGMRRMGDLERETKRLARPARQQDNRVKR